MAAVRVHGLLKQSYASRVPHPAARARLHIKCVGPDTPGRATFVFEAGAGSPGQAYAMLADAVAAGGRRACYWDRLGLGYSDGALNPAPPRAVPAALASLLAAAGERPPFVLAGHSAGGDLAIQFAATHSNLTAGLALMDSYSDAAIDLVYGGALSGPRIQATLDAYRAVRGGGLVHGVCMPWPGRVRQRHEGARAAKPRTLHAPARAGRAIWAAALVHRHGRGCAPRAPAAARASLLLQRPCKHIRSWRRARLLLCAA